MIYCVLDKLPNAHQRGKPNGCNFSFLLGQFLSLHAMVRFPVHSLPPYFADREIFLVCVPWPHVSLQLDHGDIMQSANDRRE